LAKKCAFEYQKVGGHTKYGHTKDGHFTSHKIEGMKTFKKSVNGSGK
jgi:hypothetical protein